ncbi:helix-turn-helix domain-containing protein [Cerasicoccus frondis]|uniref:helix-turn-helix domain-containing protein n=1 Tax=Cerasicoccus frondis TaxID=490090 RepID=UPI00285288A2|nr:helix-turn-helix domain-containing protein [Cerasicoccus frondis]
MSQANLDDPQAFTTAEAAQRLGISIAALYRFITDGKITPQVKRDEVLISAEQIDGLFDELARNHTTYVGALEALRDKVCVGLHSVSHTDDAVVEVSSLVNDFFRRMAKDQWDSLTLRIDLELGNAELNYRTDGSTNLLATLELKLAREIAASLCATAQLDASMPAARSAFTYAADDEQTRFHAAHAVAVDSEHVHVIRFEQDHPDFERIWKLTDAQRPLLESALEQPGGLYLLSSPRDLPGAFHLLSIARRLCPEQRTGVLLSRRETLRREGFLTEIVYGEDEAQPSLGDALKTVFALDAAVAVFAEITNIEQARGALELSAAGVPTVAFLSGSSLAESFGEWRAWGIGAAAMAREVRIGVERRGSSRSVTYRLLCDAKQLRTALAAENPVDALESLMQ